MSDPDNTTLGDLAYRIGYALGELDKKVRGKAGAAAPETPAETGPPSGDGGRETATDIEPLLIRATETWLLSRLLRPRPVRWPMVILAGLGATALSDLVRRFETPDAQSDDIDEIAFRYAAGIATASAYAAVLYPRLSGRPLTRGLLFGLIEVLAAPHGGVVVLGRKLAPTIKLPLQGLALPVDDEAGPLAHLAFGAGLGLLYRGGGDPDLEPDEEPDDDDQ